MECKQKNSTLGDFITGVMVIVITITIVLTIFVRYIEPKHNEMEQVDNEIQLRLDSLSIKLNIMETKLDCLLIKLQNKPKTSSEN